MSGEEAPQLHDMFRGVSANGTDSQPAQYVVQFLWRDLTSHFNVIGHVSQRPRTQLHDRVCAPGHGCLLQLYGFEVSTLVCDGA
jgi:hypothetical protein